ncbi:MAG: SpoIID/LytB domain-containing protein [Cyanobacteria bacterium P01_D01_bin.105]
MAAQSSTSIASAAFAKNWLFGLTNRQAGQDFIPLKPHRQGLRLRKGLAWCGGFLLWLLLVLPAQAAVELRVAIAQGNDDITVGSSTSGIISDGNGRALFRLPELQGISIADSDNDVDLVSGGNALAASSAFWLEPSDDGFVWIGDKWYRGKVQVTLEDGELTAINHVELEDYLYSVVGSEMPTSWPQAALQSQAVAARSYALFKRSRSTKPLYDVDATTNYQVYKGIQQEHPNTIAAVDATANKVITHNGQIIEAIFHSSSGGFTENAGEVWSKDVPYLQGVEDFDHSSPVFSWEAAFTLAEFSEKIGVGEVKRIGEPKLSSGGRVVTIEIEGKEGTKTMRGRDVRAALRLRSTRFNIEIDEEKEMVAVTGSGFGHGVGMSQWGARSLADQGWSFEQILQHYYRSTVVALLDS